MSDGDGQSQQHRYHRRVLSWRLDERFREHRLDGTAAQPAAARLD